MTDPELIRFLDIQIRFTRTEFLHRRMIFERNQFLTAAIALAKGRERSLTGGGSFPLPKTEAAMVERPYFLRAATGCTANQGSIQ
jgi:hypothetical protein